MTSWRALTAQRSYWSACLRSITKVLTVRKVTTSIRHWPTPTSTRTAGWVFFANWTDSSLGFPTSNSQTLLDWFYLNAGHYNMVITEPLYGVRCLVEMKPIYSTDTQWSSCFTVCSSADLHVHLYYVSSDIYTNSLSLSLSLRPTFNQLAVNRKAIFPVVCSFFISFLSSNFVPASSVSTNDCIGVIHYRLRFIGWS